MKFEKLIIRNIASVAEAEIDFTAPPLAYARLFLINGPTGAGKPSSTPSVWRSSPPHPGSRGTASAKVRRMWCLTPNWPSPRL